MEPVRLSHRDRGPPAAAASSLLRLTRGGAGGGQQPGSGEDGVVDPAEDESTGGDSAAMRRLDEDRLLAALLADGGAPDLGRCFSIHNPPFLIFSILVHKENRLTRLDLLEIGVAGQGFLRTYDARLLQNLKSPVNVSLISTFHSLFFSLAL
jgi:hypothetical protein